MHGQHVLPQLQQQTPTPLSSPSDPLHEVRAQLGDQFIQAVVRFMIMVGVPVNLLISSSIMVGVWVFRVYPVAFLISHLFWTVVIHAPAWFLVRRGRAYQAIVAILLMGTLAIFVQMWILREPRLFGFVTLVVVLPALVLPWRQMVVFIASAELGFLAMVWLIPGMHGSYLDWWTFLLMILVISSAFIATGCGVQRLLDRFAETSVARERDAAYRTRLEQRHALIQAAGHDLLSPCKGLIAYTKALQTQPGSDVAMALRQIHALAHQLQRRIYVLLDEAKAVEEQTPWATIPSLDMAAVVEVALPDLRELVAALHSPAPRILFDSGGKCEVRIRDFEVQRILENLVVNSAEVGAETIWISVYTTADAAVELVVQDDGGGYPTQMLQHPIQPVYTDRYYGSGLGLVGIAANVQRYGANFAITSLTYFRTWCGRNTGWIFGMCQRL